MNEDALKETKVYLGITNLKPSQLDIEVTAAQFMGSCKQFVQSIKNSKKRIQGENKQETGAETQYLIKEQNKKSNAQLCASIAQNLLGRQMLGRQISYWINECLTILRLTVQATNTGEFSNAVQYLSELQMFTR